MMKKSHLITIAVLLALLIVVALVTYFLVKNKAAEVPQETIDTFSNKEGQAPYTDLDGNPVSLNEYLGKVLVVITWASWSPFSVNDLSTLTDLSAEYRDKDVVFMAINRKESKEQAARYLQTVDPQEGVVMVLDPRDNFYVATGGYAMPEAVIYNSNGVIISHSHGIASADDIRTTLNEIFVPEESSEVGEDGF